MKIVILDRKTLGEDLSIEIFSSYGEVSSYDTTTPDLTKDRISGADIVLTNKVVLGENELKDSRVKLICVMATGTNNIDLEYAKSAGIEVKNVSGYSTTSVAQLTFASILYFMQKLDYFKSYVDDGQWQKSEIFTHLGVTFGELSSKKVGIIGLGTIGSDVARKLKAFDADVIYYSTSGQNSSSEFKRVELYELLRECDIVSIHAALNEKTHNLITAKELDLLKDGAILLNMGRGGIVNEQDLAHAIDKKEIYAALDVITKEPIGSDNPLLKVKHKERLLITPHIGWASVEARSRLIDAVAKNIEQFLSKK